MCNCIKNHIYVSIIIFILVYSEANKNERGFTMKIIPKINGLQVIHDSEFQIPNVLIIYGEKFSDESIAVLTERLRNVHIKVKTVNSREEATVRLKKDESILVNGYKVEVTDRTITLFSADEIGMKHALTTLFVMIVEGEKTNNRIIRSTTFSDVPKYTHRGLLVDVSRHFFTIDVMKSIVEEMSRNKLNVLHWHLSDDQGWRIQSEVYPNLTKFGEFYTKQEIREFIQYARARGVEVIPEIDLPGHTSAILAAYPELSCFGEQVSIKVGPGVYKTVLCAGSEKTIKFLKQLLDELVELFPSKRFHIGGDEVPRKNWETCPTCQALMEKEQIPNYDDLQYNFTKQLKDHLETYGVEVICWNETLRANGVKEDLITQYWVDFTPEQKAKEYIENGQPVIFSDLFACYFDYPYAMVPLQKTYEYEPTARLQAINTLGIEGAIWTERVSTLDVLSEMISPRIQALAEAAWTFERNYEEFLDRLKANMEELQLVTLNGSKFEKATISGEEAFQEAKQFLLYMFQMMQSGEVEMELAQAEQQHMLSHFLNGFFNEEQAKRFLSELGGG